MDPRARMLPEALSDRVDSMQAVLTDTPFSDPGWVHERKLDGLRCVAVKSDQRICLDVGPKCLRSARGGPYAVRALPNAPVGWAAADG